LQGYRYSFFHIIPDDLLSGRELPSSKAGFEANALAFRKKTEKLL